MGTTVQHRTIKLKKSIKASPQKVFKAFSNPKHKEKWSAPKGDEIRFLESNFKVGGIETFKCGSIGALDFNGIVHFEDILKNERIVYTETVFHKKNKLATALITIEFEEDKGSTLIKMIIQVASYCGEQMLKGCETGYKSSLNNLKEYLSKV